jgi:hypothetical protein
METFFVGSGCGVVLRNCDNGLVELLENFLSTLSIVILKMLPTFQRLTLFSCLISMNGYLFWGSLLLLWAYTTRHRAKDYRSLNVHHIVSYFKWKVQVSVRRMYFYVLPIYFFANALFWEDPWITCSYNVTVILVPYEPNLNSCLMYTAKCYRSPFSSPAMKHADRHTASPLCITFMHIVQITYHEWRL